MKPLSLFYVITGILGIGSMDTAGIDYIDTQESIEITMHDFSSNLQSENNLYIISTKD